MRRQVNPRHPSLLPVLGDAAGAEMFRAVTKVGQLEKELASAIAMVGAMQERVAAAEAANLAMLQQVQSIAADYGVANSRAVEVLKVTKKLLGAASAFASMASSAPQDGAVKLIHAGSDYHDIAAAVAAARAVGL